MDVWWNNHFLNKDLESSNWNNHSLAAVLGSRYFQIMLSKQPEDVKDEKLANNPPYSERTMAPWVVIWKAWSHFLIWAKQNFSDSHMLAVKENNASLSKLVFDGFQHQFLVWNYLPAIGYHLGTCKS